MKHHRKHNIARRRRRIERGGIASKPMYVLAGLPPELYTWARNFLHNKQPAANVVGAPSSVNDGALYPPALVKTLLRAVTGFSVRRHAKDTLHLVAPQSISLLYVPARDEEQLLQLFDFAVLAVALKPLAVFDVEGRQLRHQREAVGQILQDFVSAAGQQKLALDELRQRIGRLSDQEALLLPPQNFHLANQHVLATLFVEFRLGIRPITDRFPELKLEALSCNEIPRIQVGAVRRVYVDARQVAFLTAHPTAYHGEMRVLEEPTLERNLHSVLRSLFRFGVQLPMGFHHDAQRRDGLPFRDFPFYCDQDGSVLINATHSNVYANEFIRANGKRKI